MTDNSVETNRRNWESRVPIHAQSDFYDLDSFVRDRRSRIGSIERAEVGDVAGKSLLHIQCHLGTDTLSWALLGAEVTGLDFSPAALDEARKLASAMDLPAEFCEGDAQDFDLGKTFDIVFASAGVFCWIEDLTRWMRMAKNHLSSNGFLYVFDSHPITWPLADGTSTPAISDEFSYFDKDSYLAESKQSYAGSGLVENPVTFQWNHTVSDILRAASQAGLYVEFFHEHPVAFYPKYPYLQPDGEYWRAPGDPLPLTFSLRAAHNVHK